MTRVLWVCRSRWHGHMVGHPRVNVAGGGWQRLEVRGGSVWMHGVREHHVVVQREAWGSRSSMGQPPMIYTR